MAGGLMQLVAYGAQDIYLTGNPKITWFKSIYRRHTNYASESIEQTAMGNSQLGKKIKVTVGRNGDLVNRMVLEINLPSVSSSDSDASGSAALISSFKWTDDVGFHAVKSVNVEIGGQEIDKHTGDWMNVWSSLTTKDGVYSALSSGVGNRQKFTLNGAEKEDASWALTSLSSAARDSAVLFVPLCFWFNRNIGLSLPLIALQYHEVSLNIELRPVKELVVVDMLTAGSPDDTLSTLLADLSFGGSSASNAVAEVSLWVDYVYLDTDERRRFAQVSHEYLIEQVQVHTQQANVNRSGDSNLTSAQNFQLKLNFNHPVKVLVFALQLEKAVENNLYSSYSNMFPSEADNFTASPPGSKTPVGTVKLTLNGSDRFATRNADYFNKMVPLFNARRAPVENTGVMVYSFAERFDKHQPSGSCNFSRIDNTTLHLNGCVWDVSNVAGDDTSFQVNATCWAVNYNVLRIMSGMGGLAYSN